MRNTSECEVAQGARIARHTASPGNWRSIRASTVISLLGLSLLCHGQSRGSGNPRVSDAMLQKHYDAAFHFQDLGRVAQADGEHRLFLGMALHRIANGRANLGEYALAAPLYEEALKLAPEASDFQLDNLELDYAGAALDAGDAAKARRLAQSAVDRLPEEASPRYAGAIALLAQAMWGCGEHKEALDRFKAAAQIEPTFKRYYTLLSANLALADTANASKLITEMEGKFGDTAQIHMQFGRGYALARLFAESVNEFQRAISKDGRLAGVHYSLGASYMQLYGEEGYAKAEAEFLKELANNPNDSFTYPQLGRIAMSRHNFARAESYLKRAVQLDSKVPGTFLAMGELYVDMERPEQAELAFRKAIAIIADPSKNDWEGQRAHYWLGRTLIDNGKIAEARRELKIAEELAIEKKQEQEAELNRSAAAKPPLAKTHDAAPADRAAETNIESKMGPLLASSYDNLGIHAAMGGDYAVAARYFKQTALWSPKLKGVDANWGRAAFEAHDFAQAAGPLSRALDAHLQDAELRSMLGLSQYFTHDYAAALSTLRPMEAGFESNPLLQLALAGSMLKTGDRDGAMDRLKRITKSYPDAVLAHSLLGQAYAENGNYQTSAEELREALLLDPSNAESTYQLSVTLVALGQKSEARLLLTQLAESGSTDANVYAQLGRLQFGAGERQQAVSTLQTATRLNPANAAFHLELAEVYRAMALPEEAAREESLSENLQAKHTSANLSGISTTARKPSDSQKN